MAVCDRGIRKGKEHAATTHHTNWLWISEDGGQSWSGPHATPVVGKVPDQLIELTRGEHAGRWLLSAHSRITDDPAMKSAQRLWWSDDQGKTWMGPSIVAQSSTYHFCEGSTVELPSGELICFLRENSSLGYDAFKVMSSDGGATWSEPVNFPLPACHRPVAGMLSDGRVLITHRFMQGGHGWLGWWTQNFFAALTDVPSCLAARRNEAHTRILPIDFDRSPDADAGYSGWVQFDNGELFIVNYIVDDHHPRAQIRGYALELDRFELTRSET